MNGQAVRQVKQFSYLGSILTSDGRCDTEIKRRTGVAMKAFKDLANILTNRKVKLDTRKSILNSYVWRAKRRNNTKLRFYDRKRII